MSMSDPVFIYDHPATLTVTTTAVLPTYSDTRRSPDYHTEAFTKMTKLCNDRRVVANFFHSRVWDKLPAGSALILEIPEKEHSVAIIKVCLCAKTTRSVHAF